ncbi:hypothetical protein HK097_008233 [Rhizophlyctis rosea]|uniref:DNA (cytosine-5-)-methyltransferase n=1 Tax=Rhizophlyctis rosea TaxID=64517 RepID=A0AAD5SD89_9FUNG|nr:hypothetical protein HK097_008233 [Rhizophlyctis rosea]
MLPKARIWNDITTYGCDCYGQGGNESPLVDIVYGGFPCPDISSAGGGEGLAGDRSGLFVEILRILPEFHANVFLENLVEFGMENEAQSPDCGSRTAQPRQVMRLVACFSAAFPPHSNTKGHTTFHNKDTLYEPSSGRKARSLQTKLDLLKLKRSALRQTSTIVSETHQKAFELNKELTETLPHRLATTPEHMATIEANVESLGELESVSRTILMLLQSHEDLGTRLDSLMEQIIYELSLQEDRLRIRATYRDFVSQLRDELCADMDEKFADGTLTSLGWDVVTWAKLKDKIDSERLLKKKDPSYRSVISDAFDSVLDGRGLDRKGIDTLLKFEKEAADVFHKGDVSLETAQKQLEEEFPPDLLAYKPYLQKALSALKKTK